MQLSEPAKKKYVVSVDFGTTSVRCCLYNLDGESEAWAAERITQYYPHQGWNEIDPEECWQKFKQVFHLALQKAGAEPSQVLVFGMATQRGTFCTWDKRTGRPFHRFITWKDLRADQLVKTWNNSWTVTGLRLAGKLLYTFSRQKRFLSGSIFRFMNGMVCTNLRWMLDNCAELRQAAEIGQAAMGTIDSYIVYRLTKGQVHATDYSNVCVTGLYDPYTLQWLDLVLTMLSIPRSLLPQVKDSAGDWGSIDANIFGAEIPIGCVVSDQSASLFGSFCFKEGDVRLSMGTGTFLSLNTGSKPHTSLGGLYPVIGWKIADELVYVAEGTSKDTATIIEWCRNIGLFENYEDIEGILNSVKDSGEVYFVPAFSGIQAPVNDESAASGLIGVQPWTRREHILRACVESLAFRVYQLWQLMTKETGRHFSTMRVDGGVSRNDFLMQLICDLTHLNVERPVSIETAAGGAAYMAGLAVGAWTSRDSLASFAMLERRFTPDETRWLDYGTSYTAWRKAVQRFCHWY